MCQRLSKEQLLVQVTEAPKTDEKPAEEAAKEEKPRIFKRPTLKWGKKRDEPAAPKEPEQAKDIREDALGWIAQQIPPAVHKVRTFSSFRRDLYFRRAAARCNESHRYRSPM